MVVTPEVGLAPTVASLGAGLVAGSDAGGIADAITTLMNDPARRREMGARGQAAVRERFSWPAVAAQMESLYDTVVASASVRS